MHRHAYFWEQSIWSSPLLGKCGRESGTGMPTELALSCKNYLHFPEGEIKLFFADFLTLPWNPPWLFKSMLGSPFSELLWQLSANQKHKFCILLYKLHKTMFYPPKSSVCSSTASDLGQEGPWKTGRPWASGVQKILPKIHRCWGV